VICTKISPVGRSHDLHARNLPPHKADIGRIIAVLEAILAHQPGENDLASGEAWL
jgi:hypothetical protein